MKYLIDFENVASNGFEGLELLDDGSELLIFYSEQHSTISITVHQELERSRIRKTYMPIKTGGKNALDFQLVSWLGYEIAKNGGEQFVIVSKDTGFDAVVDFWQKRNVSVSRHPDLRKAVKKTFLKRASEVAAEIPEEPVLPEETREEDKSGKAKKSKLKKKEKRGDKKKNAAAKENRVFQGDVKSLIPEFSGEASRIAETLRVHKTKQAVNNALVKIYGTETAGKIYKGIKPLLKGRKGE